MIRHFKLCCWKVGRKVEDEEVKKKIQDGTSKSETYLIVFFSGQTTEALRSKRQLHFFFWWFTFLVWSKLFCLPCRWFAIWWEKKYKEKRISREKINKNVHSWSRVRFFFCKRKHCVFWLHAQNIYLFFLHFYFQTFSQMVKNKKEELGNIIMVKLVSPRKSARHEHREENKNLD